MGIPNDSTGRGAGPRRQRGAVAILLAVALLALLAMAGLALDGGHLMLNKTRLQNAVDAAALSGARTLTLSYGATGAGDAARAAALATLELNATAPGNEELGTALAAAGGAGSFATVEFSSSIYGTFTTALPGDARYVRVTVAEYGLSGFFWNLLASLGNGAIGPKQVAALATAGPAPALSCDITPLMVCGDSAQVPDAGQFWGHRFGDLKVLKNTDWQGAGTGSGNYQLLDLMGGGADEIREGLAAGVARCYQPGDTVQTKTGSNAGPVRQGFNTRFGLYDGTFRSSRSSYPPDYVTRYTSHGNKGLEMAGNAQQGTEYIAYRNSPVRAEVAMVDGKPVASIVSEAGERIDGYDEWQSRSADCVTNSSGTASASGCEPDGVAERRIIKLVVADCSVGISGKTEITVLGIGCFFALQPMSSAGNDEIFGQFVRQCTSDGQGVMNPAANPYGPQVIQLYKTYIDGVGTPSNDS